MEIKWVCDICWEENVKINYISEYPLEEWNDSVMEVCDKCKKECNI